MSVDGLKPLLDALTPAERRDLDRLLATSALGDLPVGSFHDFIARAYPTYQFWPYIAQLVALCERIVSGELRRVIIEAPVRHGKSVLLSRLLPAYYLRRHPTRWVSLSSYSADIAHINSRQTRTYYTGQAGALDVEAIKHWETGHGGGLWATGVGGPATGKGFHLGIIDDPIKDAKEAQSEIVRRGIRDWFDATFYSRQEPDAAIVLTMARWHELDLVGELLDREEESPERWHIVHWPALAEPWPLFPNSCTVEPDAQRVDGVLCPERYPREELMNRQRRVGAYWFSALWQQRPQPREGNFFKREWFPIVPTAPKGLTYARGWDFGATAGDGDPTAGVKVGLDRATGKLYVVDVTLGQWAPGPRDHIVRQTAALDGYDCLIGGEQEPGAAGKTAAHVFISMLEGYPVSVVPASGDKVIRAEPFAAQASIGNVAIVAGAWNRSYIDELMAFPTGRHDDQVDATAQAYRRLLNAQPPSVRPVSLTQRSKWT